MDNILARKIQLRHNIDPCKPTGSTSMHGQKNTETSWEKSSFAQKKMVSPDCPLPRTSGPRTSNLEPQTSGPRTSDLGPRTSDLGPRTSDLGPRTSNLGPRTSDLGPRTSDLGPRTSNLGPRTSNHGPRTSDLDLGPRTSDLESRTSDLEPRTSDLGPRPRTSGRARCQVRSAKILKFEGSILVLNWLHHGAPLLDRKGPTPKTRQLLAQNDTVQNS